VLNAGVENDISAWKNVALPNAEITGYLIANKNGQVIDRGGGPFDDVLDSDGFLKQWSLIQNNLNNSKTLTALYKAPNAIQTTNPGNKSQILYFGSIPDSDKIIGVLIDNDDSCLKYNNEKSDVLILSLITQAVRAFNRAENLESILKIVLIGVTAGSGLGFNRAFILLKSEDKHCLRGALANGPSSPEEADIIWQQLSRGELSLEKMFSDALENHEMNNPPLNGSLKNIIIPLDNNDNIFARAAIEKKSMIIDEITLASDGYSDLHSMIGPGPFAVVPLAGNEHLQGVLIADNFITRKAITQNDIHLLEIFARYASDSIENFKLYEHLEKKILALKRANETIINGREFVIKAERLSVLTEMANEVAHEIRNPLTVIGGFAKSMLKKMNQENENYEYLNIIFEQVQRISDSLEKFTSLINYESKADIICDLGDLVRSALLARMPGSNFTKFEVNSRQDIKIKIDPDLFRQALLIAMKQINVVFRGGGPFILTIEQNDDRAYIYFETSDHDDQFAKRLYKSFQSGGNNEILRQLSTTLEILKYYRGNIGIEAVDQNINRFYIELPVYRED